MAFLKNICAGGVLLVFSATFSSVFVYWLLAESVDERMYRIYVEHDKLVLQRKGKEAKQLFADALAAERPGPLDPVWLPFIRTVDNGYVQLDYYVRTLAGAPDREAIYKEISHLMESAPPAFHEEIKPRLLADLIAIPEINHEWLNEYGLLAGQAEQSNGNEAQHEGIK